MSTLDLQKKSPWWLKIIKAGHWLYKAAIAPFLGNCCRFEPTCSDYALGAFTRHGFWRGLGLSLQRVLRCHPWNKGGEDQVPLQ